MRLHKFTVRNFKAIGDLEFNWEDLLVLIGENNCGKSSALSALSLFLSGGTIKDPLLFHRHITDKSNAIELTGHFDQLTAEELSQIAVRGRTYQNEWILRKKFWLESGAAVDGTERSSWKEQLDSYSARENFVGWPSPDTTWASFNPEYQPLIAKLPGTPNRPNAGNREQLKQIVRTERPDLIQPGAPDWQANPGGGGNWKSNANSILPHCIFIPAVQEATEESQSKDASTYGKLINLIVESQLSQRQEVQDLQTALKGVLDLFSYDPEHPERQATEIRDLEARINSELKEVISAEAKIRTEAPQINSLLLPNTELVVRDAATGIDTKVVHQGNGLQRTLVMTLLQLLAEAQESQTESASPRRAVVLIVEEPELFMHPQMERRMRDLLYRLSAQQNFQVACCTHSPIFIDIANRHKAIVKMSKATGGAVSAKQVTKDLFVGPGDAAEKHRLDAVSKFNPGTNELFFAKEVVLVEGATEVATFEKAAELTGLFRRHPLKKRDVSLIKTDGKKNIPTFQRVLNEFDIPYRVVHDEDRGNPSETSFNAKILALAGNTPLTHPIHMVSPKNIESVLGGPEGNGLSKPYAAVCKIEEMYNQNAIPEAFLQALNFVYFGTLTEPSP